MKMTDEQMKALVKFARDIEVDWGNYTLPRWIDHELICQIGYNINIALDQYYDTEVHIDIYDTRMKCLDILHSWIHSTEQDRRLLVNRIREYDNLDNSLERIHLSLSKELQASKVMKNTITYLHNIAAINGYTSITAKPHQIMHYEYWLRHALGMSCGVCDNLISHGYSKQIIIKTILDYYNEDFETFEALYL